MLPRTEQPATLEARVRPKVGIIGLGHVGRVMMELFQGYAQIVTYDILSDHDYPYDALADCDIAVVCVGTPGLENGSCDISHVRDAVAQLPTRKVLLKSTVPPGTTELLIAETGKEICFSPEYVGETTFYNPFWDHGVRSIPFVIVGGAPPIRKDVIELLQPVLGPHKSYFQCPATEAEIIKYMENAFLATKLTFVTEFYNICRSFSADWHTVREGWLLDSRIGNSHTAVFPTALGFSGKCLPKDLRAIVQSSIAAGYSPSFLLEVLTSNHRFQNEAADSLSDLEVS